MTTHRTAQLPYIVATPSCNTKALPCRASGHGQGAGGRGQGGVGGREELSPPGRGWPIGPWSAGFIGCIIGVILLIIIRVMG